MFLLQAFAPHSRWAKSKRKPDTAGHVLERLHLHQLLLQAMAALHRRNGRRGEAGGGGEGQQRVLPTQIVLTAIARLGGRGGGGGGSATMQFEGLHPALPLFLVQSPEIPYGVTAGDLKVTGNGIRTI